MDPVDDTGQLIRLESEKEFRFVVDDPDEKIIICLTEGNAEIFGTELNMNQNYEFSYFSAVSIFTPTGCTLRFDSNVSESRYRINNSKQTIKMKELYDYLQYISSKPQMNNIKCPITLIVGPTDVGKSTLCRFLLNYAARCGKETIFIDLDVGQSSLSITGTFGVLPVVKPSDVNGKFDESTLSVYYFGYNSPGHNMALYELLLEKLSSALNSRLKYASDFKNTGVIIDSCGWVDGKGYDLIIQIITILEVNTVFVIGKYSLYSNLMNDLDEDIDISFVPEFKNTAIRNKNIRRINRESSITEYFYGLSNNLNPYVVKINFSDLHVFKAKSSSILKRLNSEYDDSNIISIDIDPSILYHVLGLSYAEQTKDILLSSVCGFTCIIDLNLESNIASLLSPQPGPLPSKYFILGDITFIPPS